MAGGEGSKPILKINVDVDEWTAFADSFSAYQKKLEEQGDAWASTNKGIRQQKDAFNDAEKAFAALVKSSTSDKFSSPTSGVFARIGKESREVAKSWAVISREIDKASRGLTGIARNGGLSVFGLFGTAGALAGGLYGATSAAAGSVAGAYKSSRQLGLEIGKEKEFGIAGTPYGLGRDQLEEAANAKADPTKQLAFLNAGVSPQDLATKDAAELAWLKARGEARMYAQWEKTSPQFAVAQAQAYFPDENPDQLRLLADASNKGDLDRSYESYERNWQKVGYTEQQGEQATKFQQDQAQKWAAIEAAWNKDILLLAPHLDKWATAAENLVISFLDNTAKTVKNLADAGDNPTPPGTTPEHAAPNDYPGRIREGFQIAAQWLQAHGLSNPFNSDTAPAVQPGFTSDPNKIAHMSLLEMTTGMPKGMLQAEENIESSGGRNNINPNNPKVMGAFQFDEPTAAKYGVNRADEYSSTVGASRYLSDLHKKYGSWAKAAAAFDGFKGLDADISKYGDAWESRIDEFQKSGETANYLKKLRDQGVDLSEDNKPKTPFDNPKTIKKMSENDPQIVPFTSADQKAKDASDKDLGTTMDESLVDRLMRGLGIMGSAISEGGGSVFRSPDSPRMQANPTPQQFNIGVTVTAPSGSNVQVTGAQLAQ